MRIILDDSGYGFKFTAYGYDALIRRKAEDPDLAIIWTKEFIDENIDEVWFRCDKDVIDIAEKYTLGVILNGFKVEDVSLPGIDIINDKRVKVEECEEYGFSERLILEIA